MQYYRVVKNDELSHSGLPSDMKKKWDEVRAALKNNINGSLLRSLTWPEAKAHAHKEIYAVFGGTGGSQYMRSADYQSRMNEFRLRWERAHGIYRR